MAAGVDHVLVDLALAPAQRGGLRLGRGDLGRDRRRAVQPLPAQPVLRNTYWLLALSMVPTVLGAWIGVSTGITAP
jgi:hypothetical protein